MISGTLIDVGSILVVQADPTPPMWATVLDDAGHTTQVVTHVRDALPFVRDGGIEVIVIDAIDPRDGIAELAKKLANLPDAPPVVLVSSSPFAPEISVRIGAAAFLAKPCDPDELVALIGRMVTHTRPVFLVELDDEPTGQVRIADAGKITAS